jgi:hypothetical protein
MLAQSNRQIPIAMQYFAATQRKWLLISKVVGGKKTWVGRDERASGGSWRMEKRQDGPDRA